MNPKEETRLIGPEGRPIFGIHDHPVESFNLSDLRIYGKDKKGRSGQKFHHRVPDKTMGVPWRLQR